MINNSFRCDQVLLIDLRPGKIINTNSNCCYIEFEDSAIVRYELDELLTLFKNGKLIFAKESAPSSSINILGDTKNKALARQEAYVSALKWKDKPGSRNTIRSVIDSVSMELKDLNPPSVSAVNNWYRKYCLSGNSMSVLIKLKEKSRQKRIKPEIINLIFETLDKYYLDNKANTRRAVSHRLFVAEYKKRGYDPSEMPARSTYYEYAKQLEPIKVLKAKLGSIGARKALRLCKDKHNADFLLEQVQFDSVKVSIVIIDKDGNVIGSPQIYLMIDVYSRLITGFSITYGEKGETVSAIIECLKHSMLPKSRDRYPYLRNEWPAFGIPTNLVIDGGGAFNSGIITSLLNDQNITRLTTETRQPWKKPHIESFNNTIKVMLLETLPGYVAKYRENKSQEYDKNDLACLYEDEFEQLVVSYICDEYHIKPHDDLKKETPLSMWHKGTYLAPPRLPPHISDIEKFAGVMRKCTISDHKGIKINSQRYNNEQLKDLYLVMSQHGDKKNKVDVMYNEFDISRITVISPYDSSWFFVSCVDRSIAPNTRLKKHKQRNLAIHAEMPTPIIFDNPIIATAKQRQKTRMNSNHKIKRRSINPRDDTALTPDELNEMISSEQQRQSKNFNFKEFLGEDDPSFHDNNNIDFNDLSGFDIE
nr:hypothetical protein [uncultured Tolumonas sp.]